MLSSCKLPTTTEMITSHIALRCEICNKDKHVTFTYIENLSRNGSNDDVLICPTCFAVRMMNELLHEMNNKK